MRSLLAALILFSAAPARADANDAPNIIFLLADDLDAELMGYAGQTIDGTVFMPALKARMIDRGLTFANFYVTFPSCCPSRASILRGQYPHSTGVKANAPPRGGFQRFYALGREESTVATWLQDNGYRTGYLGKYLNHYPEKAPSNYVPKGWADWHVLAPGAHHNFTLYENGRRVRYRGKDIYSTDVLAKKAVQFLRRDDDRPFFLFVSPFVPHVPFTPAARHRELFPNFEYPASPAVLEDDLSDKPSWIRDPKKRPVRDVEDEEGQSGGGNDGRGPAANRASVYKQRMRMMMSMDDLIRDLFAELDRQGKTASTYVFFMSDNGYHSGEHGLSFGKGSPYEVDIHVPFYATGPGVPQGKSVPHLSINNDVAPTLAALTRSKTPRFVEGRSLAPLLRSNPPPLAKWRSSILVEYDRWMKGQPPNYRAIRTLTGSVNDIYVEYEGADPVEDRREFYCLDTDPHQLDNAYRTTEREVLEDRKSRLESLKGCEGGNCREAEDRKPAVKKRRD